MFEIILKCDNRILFFSSEKPLFLKQFHNNRFEYCFQMDRNSDKSINCKDICLNLDQFLELRHCRINLCGFYKTISNSL